ncbi:MAG: DNA polymerase [Bacteroidetes bacterium]|nr:MAG: DNA polymerase [Bacteroidota bacterium]
MEGSAQKVLWPGDGLTRADLIAYYEAVAPFMLPYLKDRPVTVEVFPDGIGGTRFFRRWRPDDAPDWMRSVPYQPVTVPEPRSLILIDDLRGLRWWVERGAIAFHTWACRLPDVDHPDQAIFDLDPGRGADFEAVLAAALVLRDWLHRQGLEGYARTSGGQGMHVVVPLHPVHSFDQVRAWVKRVAEDLASTHEDLMAVAHGATHRGDRVTIDHAQNSVGRNTATTYTVRGLPGAPVAAPVTWREVAAHRLRPGRFTLRTMPARLRRRGDVWAAMHTRAFNVPDLARGHAAP